MTFSRITVAAPDEFVDGRSLGGQPDEQSADLRIGGIARHDVQERIARLHCA